MLEKATEKETGMTLIPIRNAAFEHLPALQELYEQSFPVVERRDFNNLLAMLSEPDMLLQAIMVAGRLAGLAIHWQFRDWVYLEHLAIAPTFRSLGYGKAFIERLLQEQHQRLVLEVERPVTTEACKRIQFYQQLGFTLHSDFDYQQPPYEEHGQPVPLYLMAKPALATAADCQQTADHLREHVYERYYR